MHNFFNINWKQHSLQLMIEEGDTHLLPDNMGGNLLNVTFITKNNVLKLSRISCMLLLWFDFLAYILILFPPGAHMGSI